MDSTVSPKVKITEEEDSWRDPWLTTLRVYMGVFELQDGIRKIDNQFNYSHRLAQTKQQVG
jgi:hypothetical protein